MSLVNIGSLHRQTLQILAKTESPAGIELSSYKRNRSIAIAVLTDNHVMIWEKGYMEAEMIVDINELPKLLKTMIKREFPRSRKVRIHKFSDPIELDRTRKKL